MTENGGSQPGWTRWSVVKIPGQHGLWTVTHDCGWSAEVDLLASGQAIVDAERRHERDCR